MLTQNTIDLYPFQDHVLDRATQLLHSGRRPILQLPTGAGKTRTAARLIQTESLKHPVWFVCHRREIILQASQRTLAAFGIDHAITNSRSAPDYDNPIQVASIQTLRWRRDKVIKPGLIIWDECQHIASPLWSKVMTEFPDAMHLGLTATPERFDGKGLGDWFTDLVTGPSIRALIDAGYLSDFRMLVPTQPDLTAARIVTGGDYRIGDLDKIMGTPVLIGDALAHYERETPDARAICFASSVEHSKAVAAKFREHGIPSAHVDATTTTKVRDAAVAALERGEIKLLSNYAVFTEGFDLPAIDAVILMRPTKSLALYLQMCGRGLRSGEGKQRTTIFDHSGLYYEHGLPDSNWHWQLDGGAKDLRVIEMREKNEYTRLCPECKTAHPAAPLCPFCGFAYPSGREIGEFDGRLREPDRPRAPEGRESVGRFAKRIGVSDRATRSWLALGLPVDDNGFVKIGAAIDWMKLEGYPKNKGTKAGGPPPGYMRQSDFGKLIRQEKRTVGRLLQRGLPHDAKGFIHKVAGIEWFRSQFDDFPAYSRLLEGGWVHIHELAEVICRPAAWLRACVYIGMPHRKVSASEMSMILFQRHHCEEWIGSTKMPSDLSDPAWQIARDARDAALALEARELKAATAQVEENFSAFSLRMGVSKTAVANWAKQGMPTTAGTRVNILQALTWCERRKHSGRAQVTVPDVAWPAGRPSDLDQMVEQDTSDLHQKAADYATTAIRDGSFVRYCANFAKEVGIDRGRAKEVLREHYYAAGWL